MLLGIYIPCPVGPEVLALEREGVVSCLPELFLSLPRTAMALLGWSSWGCTGRTTLWYRSASYLAR